jgi:hypothetical protein
MNEIQVAKEMICKGRTHSLRSYRIKLYIRNTQCSELFRFANDASVKCSAFLFLVEENRSYHLDRMNCCFSATNCNWDVRAALLERAVLLTGH